MKLKCRRCFERPAVSDGKCEVCLYRETMGEEKAHRETYLAEKAAKAKAEHKRGK